MANKMIWKAVLNDEGVPQFPEGAYGHVRLWIEGEKPIPTDYWILIGDFDSNTKKLMKSIASRDTDILDSRINKIFKQAKVELKSYGKNRTFHMDIHVSEDLINGYSN